MINRKFIDFLRTLETNTNDFSSIDNESLVKKTVLAINGLNICEIELPENNLIKLNFNYHYHYYSNKLFVKIILFNTLVKNDIPFVVSDYNYSSIVLEKDSYLKMKNDIFKTSSFINKHSKDIEKQYSKLFVYPYRKDTSLNNIPENKKYLLKYKLQEFPENSENLYNICKWLDATYAQFI